MTYQKKNNRPPRPGEGRPKAVYTTAGLPEDWRDIVLDYASQGMSEVEIRANLCMNGGKFNHGMWESLIAKDAEFSEMVKKCRLLCQAWWERTCREALMHDKSTVFETGAWTMNMKNRFGWTDKVDIEHGITDETFEKYKQMSVQDLRKKITELLPGNRVAGLITEST